MNDVVLPRFASLADLYAAYWDLLLFGTAFVLNGRRIDPRYVRVSRSNQKATS